MRVFLYGCVYWFILCVFDGETKLFRVKRLFLTVLKRNVHSLKLVQKVIDNKKTVDLSFRRNIFEREVEDHLFERLNHEKLLKNRVHVTRGSKVFDSNKSGLLFRDSNFRFECFDQLIHDLECFDMINIIKHLIQK